MQHKGIAPTSSHDSQRSMNTRRLEGMRLPAMREHPLRNRCPSPWVSPPRGPPRLIDSMRNKRAGRIIPPSAAMMGRAAWRMEDDSPFTISRLISSPTTRKTGPSIRHQSSGAGPWREEGGDPTARGSYQSRNKMRPRVNLPTRERKRWLQREGSNRRSLVTKRSRLTADAPKTDLTGNCGRSLHQNRCSSSIRNSDLHRCPRTTG